VIELAENVTEYQPTETEEKILEFLMNPANRMKPVTEICAMVNCSTRTYYRAFEKPDFVAHYNKVSLEVVKQSVMPVVHAFQREAVRGSFQHGKVILEMAGIYKETVRKEVTGKDGDPIEHTVTSRVAGMTPEERKAAVEEIRRQRELTAALETVEGGESSP
jgi:hypothetical protein